MRALGLSCHSLVDSSPMRVCFGRSGTLGGSARGGWWRFEVGGLGAGLAGRGRDWMRFWSLEGVSILLVGLTVGPLIPERD